MAELNWEIIGAVGEVLGAVGVLLTLFYLARQISHSTKVGLIAARQQISDGSTATSMAIAQTPSLAKAMDKARRKEPLDSAEAIQIESYMHGVLRFYEGTYLSYLDGVVSEDQWSGQRVNLRSLMRTQPLRKRTLEITENFKNRGYTMYSSSFSSLLAVLVKEIEDNPLDGFDDA